MNRLLCSILVVGVVLALPAKAVSAQGVPMPMNHDMTDSARGPVLGEIDFPTKANAASHKAFIRGVLLMHNFHYPQAAAEFQKAEALDPTDVMGYWGEAMTYTHPVWNQQDTAAARKVLMKLAPTLDARFALARDHLERGWLLSAEILYDPKGGTKAQRDTLWSQALGLMHVKYPHDDEITTFYALSLLGLNQGDREPVAYQEAYQLVLPVFRAHPHHPGAAHYLIHATDDPDHAALGLRAAEAYAAIAPSAGHAIHMTSHIFLALGKWDDVVAANRRAQNVVPDKSLAGHVVHWLHYGLIQQGRYLEADKWLDSMVKQARAPKSRKYGSWDAAGLMAAANLADTRRWSGVAGSVVVDTTRFIEEGTPEAFGDLAAIEFGYALGALNRGDSVAFRAAVERMLARQSSIRANPLMATTVGMTGVMTETLTGYNLVSRGDSAKALELFRHAADREATLPMPFGPPATIKPPREAAGELLLGMRKPAEAKKEFELALARTPRRTAALYGLARSEDALGHGPAARRIYKELVRIWHSADTEFWELKWARCRAEHENARCRL